ncbi:MAG TPA: FAD-dependent oxidoreductase, partial [Firmicutes bacterium]|nr:FAD-dependent oxidoreductase [Bacillota bacterium]
MERIIFGIKHRNFFIFIAATAFSLAFSTKAMPSPETYDVVIYGGTSAGVASAVQVARTGKSVVIIEPGQHLGGMSSSGLGATDTGNIGAIGGIANEFYRRIHVHYHGGSMNNRGTYRFEPSAAQKVFNDLIAEHDIPVVYGERLDLRNGVRMNGLRIEKIVMESGREFIGLMYIDATYEGDLMAKAGVTYTTGRESNDTYGETLNGVQVGRSRAHNFNFPVDPYLWPGDPSSGLLPGISDENPGPDGSGDNKIQAYNFRLCMTNNPENRRRWVRPAHYDPRRYELLLRYFEAGLGTLPLHVSPVPNNKSDTNNRDAFSSDNIGMNWDYPEGDYETRERIIIDHKLYVKGLCYTLAMNQRVPLEIRRYMMDWGLARNEFTDNGNWPYQMYVREARRMVSDYVMTEHNCLGTRHAPDSVGMGSYNMDSHNVQRYVDSDGLARNEGDVQVRLQKPYGISYRSIIPRKGECENLLVPVCVSASHIAYGSIRMEPVYMILGQSAGTASVLAIISGVGVQDISYGALREILINDRQVLDYGIIPETLEGIVVDDTEAMLDGEWIESESVTPFVGDGYLHDDNTQGGKSARFETNVDFSGQY